MRLGLALPLPLAPSTTRLGNQYDPQRGQGGGYDLPARPDTAQPQDVPQRPLDIPEQRQQPLDTPYRIDQGCPSCRWRSPAQRKRPYFHPSGLDGGVR